MALTLLHTSDWHLGRRLHGRRRYAEFEAFLDWLATAIERHGVDLLLVAGDVFDTPAPSPLAQSLYYRFLTRVAASRCRHVVIIAGNHDSPALLDAPRELLRALDVHVLGQVPERAGDEVLLLRDAAGQPQALVCAVPYLRDRDIRSVEAGESTEDKARKLCAGIAARYQAVLAQAAQRRSALGAAIPIIAMGHLFTAGGQTVEGDGVRELYVGSLAHVPASVFAPPGLPAPDYVALGHLHVPQVVGGQAHIRYSGSPLAMGFGEARQSKSVCVVRLAPQAAAEVQLEPVPVWQPLARVTGDWDGIAAQLHALAQTQPTAWVEVIYTGEALLPDLRARLEAVVDGTGLALLRVRNDRIVQQALAPHHVGETLDSLSVDEVFERCLDAHAIPPAQREGLRQSHHEAWLAVELGDVPAR